MYNVLSGLPCCWWWKSVVCMTAFSECRQFSVLSFENFTFWSRSWRKLVDLQLKPIVHCQKLFPQEPAAADTTSQPELKQTKRSQKSWDNPLSPPTNNNHKECDLETEFFCWLFDSDSVVTSANQPILCSLTAAAAVHCVLFFPIPQRPFYSIWQKLSWRNLFGWNFSLFSTLMADYKGSRQIGPLADFPFSIVRIQILFVFF